MRLPKETLIVGSVILIGLVKGRYERIRLFLNFVPLQQYKAFLAAKTVAEKEKNSREGLSRRLDDRN